MANKYALSPDDLRWRVEETNLPFKSTSEVDPAKGIVGQQNAIEAMRFGVECNAPGQNVYVCSITGTGRTTLVTSLMNKLKPRHGAGLTAVMCITSARRSCS